ncbi:chalcone isomerase family protein [Niveibacterium sp. 24ML]|uniref:chalcone isomerase family protein n=1 Tax=Niveibacterium sp. 24ML TaxID=2985512 RepID=UPI0022718473|nr:chalcone isomerase family protein [Niveibacterium sp. 24ML]MCX9154555.1 chalcone isomerase family protein [Niveibacterium sp. 24ML]
MLNRTLATLLLSAALIAPAAAAIDVAGVKFEDKASAGTTELTLNGAGLRKKAFFKVYAIGLYLPSKADSASAVLSSKGQKRIQIVTLRELSAEQLAEALENGVEENSNEAEMAKIKSRLEEFRSNLLAMGKVPEKSDIRIEWTGSATRVLMNGTVKGKEIQGEDFYTALLKIWFGDKPVQADLKDAMLGKK